PSAALDGRTGSRVYCPIRARQRLHFPTRRSSDLEQQHTVVHILIVPPCPAAAAIRSVWTLAPRAPLSERAATRRHGRTTTPTRPDRKSTRLNSSHSQISYDVFCMKQKITIRSAAM